MGGIERVHNLYGVYGLTGNECQKLEDFIGHNTMMIKALNFKHLIDQ